MKTLRYILTASVLTLLAATFCAATAQAQAAAGGIDQARAAMASSSRSDVVEALIVLAHEADPADAVLVEALLDGRLGRDSTGVAVLVAPDGAALVLPSREPYAGDVAALEKVVLNNQIRSKARRVLSALYLGSPEADKRLAAAKELSQDPSEEFRAVLEKAAGKESVADIKTELLFGLAQIDILSPEAAKRIKAVDILGASGNPNFITALKRLADAGPDGSFAEPDPEVRAAAARAIATLERSLFMIRLCRDLFFGLSLGSVLILAALGLAVTFGLMGVINMAHGEMLMLGAYSTYAVQQFFRANLPGYIDYYLLAALPVAIAVTCLVGVALERLVIRHLYGRPLETLLATWGLSLGLIQTVRLIFGAQNVEVANPSWLAGGVTVAPDFILTYNRLAIIAFVVVVIIMVWAILNKTSLGLKVRAVTQDRATAAAMGIYTWRVDMWTFGLGSAIAGLGGVALTQVGNVGPELGQGYIVDSFMVVVLGGVGNLAGAVFGGLGLGVLNKVLEPFMGAVLGKIMVLVLIIIFIQKRPQGLFALKGRSAE